MKEVCLEFFCTIFLSTVNIPFPASGTCYFLLQGKIRELQVLESLRLFLPTAILSLWNESLCFLLKEFQEFSKGVGGTRRGLAVPLSLCVNPALKVNQI